MTHGTWQIDQHQSCRWILKIKIIFWNKNVCDFFLFFQNPYSETWTRTREPGPILRNQDLNRTLVGDPSIVREGKSATLENNSTHCAGSICLLWIEWLIYIHHCPPVNNETWQGRNFEGVHYREIAIWTCKLSGIDIVYVHTIVDIPLA